MTGREAQFGGSTVFYPNRYGHVPLVNDEWVPALIPC